MDLHGNHPQGSGKEIRCGDCGHVYRVDPTQRSARCSVCGNVEFFASAPVRQLSREILHKNILPLLAPQQAGAETREESFLAAFRATTPDGKRVQELLVQYQVEWQLWAMVVKHFRDPAYHSAYLTQVISEGAFDQAVTRYREHRSVMALAKDSRWQAEVADLMLERLESLSLVQMQREGGSRFVLPQWLLLLPVNSRVMRFGWILLGLFLGARLFRLVF